MFKQFNFLERFFLNKPKEADVINPYLQGTATRLFTPLKKNKI